MIQFSSGYAIPCSCFFGIQFSIGYAIPYTCFIRIQFSSVMLFHILALL